MQSRKDKGSVPSVEDPRLKLIPPEKRDLGRLVFGLLDVLGLQAQALRSMKN